MSVLLYMKEGEFAYEAGETCMIQITLQKGDRLVLSAPTGCKVKVHPLGSAPSSLVDSVSEGKILSAAATPTAATPPPTKTVSSVMGKTAPPVAKTPLLVGKPVQIRNRIWDVDDNRELMRQLRKGIPIAAIAASLRRSEPAVMRRLHRKLQHLNAPDAVAAHKLNINVERVREVRDYFKQA